MLKPKDDFVRLQGQLDTLQDLSVAFVIGMDYSKLSEDQRQLIYKLSSSNLIEVSENNLIQKVVTIKYDLSYTVSNEFKELWSDE